MKCYERDCENDAGGPWSPYWCPGCDRERVERISRNLKQLGDDLKRAGQQMARHRQEKLGR
jgi:hypothetical protein